MSTPPPSCRRSARSRSGCRTGSGSCSCPLTTATVGPGYVKVSYDKHQVEDAPSIGIDGELPAGDEEAIFRHYGLPYEPGADGERRLGSPLSRPTERRIGCLPSSCCW